MPAGIIPNLLVLYIMLPRPKEQRKVIKGGRTTTAGPRMRWDRAGYRMKKRGGGGKVSYTHGLSQEGRMLIMAAETTTFRSKDLAAVRNSWLRHSSRQTRTRVERREMTSSMVL